MKMYHGAARRREQEAPLLRTAQRVRHALLMYCRPMTFLGRKSADG